MKTQCVTGKISKWQPEKDGDGKKDGKAGIARAVKRKRREDPNKDRKGKAKNVSN